MVTLRGILAPPMDSLKELPVEKLLKWYKGNEVWALAVVTRDVEHQNKPLPPTIQSVLDKFPSVFGTPTKLPLEREYDHAIPLKPEAAPFNARPYRYSPAHKDETKKQVKAMLGARINVHNMYPYASPVMLVQKKDGFWRFCIDYRRLNEMKVKNTFPMHVIDELLDELVGAKIFSKLDL